MKNFNIALCALVFLFVTFAQTPAAKAQVGYNPEFLGNAAAAPRPGFSPKIFVDYFNQNKIGGNDYEVAIEPQYWIRGFTGEEKKDYIQFLAHFPFGYRSENKTSGSGMDLGWGTGTLSANVEHFWKLIDSEDTVWWFDNGLSVGFPTGTGKEGLRLGGDAYNVTYFQENYFRFGKWIFSISPIAATYIFKDTDSQETHGLALNIMNSAYGYQITDAVALGVTTAYQLGNVMGSNDGVGGKLARTQRLYVGPAACISLPYESSLQISGLIDVHTKNVTRGQGLTMAFWKMF